MSFVNRVKDFLKGGEDASISRFQNRTKKYCGRQISLREDEIGEAKDKAEELTEELNDCKVDIDLQKIANSDNLAEYIPVYLERMNEKRNQIEDLNDSIETKKEEIKIFKLNLSDLTDK